MRARWFCLAVPPGLLPTAGCLTFSSFQTARLPEPGKPEVAIAVTRSDFRDDDEGSGWSMLEFRRRARLGRSEVLEGHVKLSVLHPDGGGLGGVLGGGVKASIVRDRLALGLPVSWYIGDVGFRLLQLHPGVVGTLPIAPGLDLNGDFEVYVLATAGTRPVYARHVGLAIGPADRRWTVRPEVGWLGWRNEGTLDTSVQFGLAVEFREPARGRAPRALPDDRGLH